MAKRGRVLRALVLVAVVSIAGCNAAPASTPAPGGSGAPSTSEASPGATVTASISDAAKAELDLRQFLRDELGIAAALGPDGVAILAADDAAEVAFGEQAMADVVEKFALDLSATAEPGGIQVASAGGWTPPARVETAEWTGSLFGATSFMLTMWMGFGPEFIKGAGGEQFQSDSQTKSKTHDETVGSAREHLVLTETMNIGVGGGKVSMDVTLQADSVLTDVATGAEIARRTSKSHGKFEVNACPSSEGAVEGHYAITNSEDVTGAGGAVGGASSTDGKFTAYDDDSAHLTRTDMNATITTGGRGGASGDWGMTGSYPVSVAAGGGMTVGTASNTSGESARGVTATGFLIAMAASYIATAAKAAETFWRSGACVEIKTSKESKNVKPKEQLDLDVEARGKFDGGPIDAPIDVAFSGKESLDPTGRVDSPATLTFKAGEKKDDKGTIELSQTSKRGIGKKTVVFTVGGEDYRVIENGVYSGTKCGSLGGAWTLNMSLPGGGGSVTFALPEGGGSGTTHGVFSLTAAGVKASYDMRGTVSSVVGADGSTSLKLHQGSGTVRVKGGTLAFTEPNTDDIKLEQGSFCGSGA